MTITNTNNLCSKVDSATVNPTTPIRPNVSFTDESCAATNDGTITFMPTGGAGGYSYTWMPNVSTTNSATGLMGGTYNITITDASNCDTSVSVVINSAAQILATVTTQNLKLWKHHFL